MSVKQCDSVAVVELTVVVVVIQCVFSVNSDLTVQQ